MTITPLSDKLVSTRWLEDHLDDGSVRVIEVGFENDDSEFRVGHVPGAVWVYWKSLCWDHIERRFATPQQMAERLASLGVSNDSQIILMSDRVQFGVYAYWVMTMAGVTNVCLLNGSRTAWVAEGRPLSDTHTEVSPGHFAPGQADETSRMGRDEVLSLLGDGRWTILDARSPEEYSGERVRPPPDFDHGAERGGRIPGARHLYYERLLDEDGTFKTVEEIEAILADVGVDPHGGSPIVSYCRLSHRASLLWFVLTELVGRPSVRVYDGSWTEWGSMVGMPIER